MRLTSWLFALVALLLAAAPLHAQPRRGVAPQFGSVQATADVASLNVQAGGADRNTIPGSGCSGFITNAAPTAVVSFGGSGPLSIYATSGTDTTLLVADPGGRWHCSDDANGSNPGLTFATAAEGDYTVWVGTFSPDAAGTAARLFTVQGSPRW
jgi:hypothetical protein